MGKSFKQSLRDLMEMSQDRMTTESRGFATNLLGGRNCKRNTPLAIAFINAEGRYADLMKLRTKRWLYAATTLINVKLNGLLDRPEQMLKFRLKTAESDAWRDESLLQFWDEAFADSFGGAQLSEQIECLAMLLSRCNSGPGDYKVGEFARDEFQNLCEELDWAEGSPVQWFSQFFSRKEHQWTYADYKGALGCIVLMLRDEAYWDELCKRNQIL